MPHLERLSAPAESRSGALNRSNSQTVTVWGFGEMHAFRSRGLFGVMHASQKRRSGSCAEEATAALRGESTGGSAVSIPFSLRAELKGVEVAPGVTLRYWEAGAGRALVMLPGLGHAASLYKYQLEGLCDEFRVIALDPRGHGEADKPELGYNYHTLAKDLDGFLRALDLNDATILGHSGGCKIILTYLELYDDSRLRAIVFSDDSPCHLRDGIFSADQALAAIDAFQGPDAIAFSKGFSDQFLTDDAEESAKEAFYRE